MLVVPGPDVREQASALFGLPQRFLARFGKQKQKIKNRSILKISIRVSLKNRCDDFKFFLAPSTLPRLGPDRLLQLSDDRF
jgi:hypothetical protein